MAKIAEHQDWANAGAGQVAAVDAEVEAQRLWEEAEWGVPDERPEWATRFRLTAELLDLREQEGLRTAPGTPEEGHFHSWEGHCRQMARMLDAQTEGALCMFVGSLKAKRRAMEFDGVNHDLSAILKKKREERLREALAADLDAMAVDAPETPQHKPAAPPQSSSKAPGKRAKAAEGTGKRAKAAAAAAEPAAAAAPAPAAAAEPAAAAAAPAAPAPAAAYQDLLALMPERERVVAAMLSEQMQQAVVAYVATLDPSCKVKKDWPSTRDEALMEVLKEDGFKAFKKLRLSHRSNKLKITDLIRKPGGPSDAERKEMVCRWFLANQQANNAHKLLGGWGTGGAIDINAGLREGLQRMEALAHEMAAWSSGLHKMAQSQAAHLAIIPDAQDLGVARVGHVKLTETDVEGC